jgi:hypothetical protein
MEADKQKAEAILSSYPVRIASVNIQRTLRINTYIQAFLMPPVPRRVQALS